METNKKIGNVEFTEQGIKMTVPYTKNNTVTIKCDKETMAKAFECAKDHIRARLKHCSEQLNANISKATYLSPDIVIWEGGHFSRPVYTNMQEFVEYSTNWDEVSKPQMQQIVRALHFNKPENSWDNDIKTKAFNIATEYLLCM